MCFSLIRNAREKVSKQLQYILNGSTGAATNNAPTPNFPIEMHLYMYTRRCGCVYCQETAVLNSPIVAIYTTKPKYTPLCSVTKLYV